MKQLFFIFLVLIIHESCVKKSTGPDSDTISIDLLIISTNTPATQIQGQDIVSTVRCAATDGCQNFSRIEIKKTGIRQFEIRAKGTFPYRKDGQIVCTLMYTEFDTTARIYASEKGQYVLNFHYRNVFFKSDTVQVN